MARMDDYQLYEEWKGQKRRFDKAEKEKYQSIVESKRAGSWPHSKRIPYQALGIDPEIGPGMSREEIASKFDDSVRKLGYEIVNRRAIRDPLPLSPEDIKEFKTSIRNLEWAKRTLLGKGYKYGDLDTINLEAKRSWEVYGDIGPPPPPDPELSKDRFGTEYFLGTWW